MLTEGEMLEWLKRHAWKACKLQKGFRGSNPRLSAKVLNKVPVAACGDYEKIPVENTNGKTLKSTINYLINIFIS